MNQKLIFLDIDGTLTVAGSNVPPQSALDAVKKAQANGHKVFLCTGRNLDMLSPLLVYGFDGVVASAGGYVVCGDQVLFDCPMSTAQFDTAMKLLHGQGVFCTIEAKDATYGDEDLGEFLSAGSGTNSEIQRWRAALAGDLGIQPMSRYDGRPIYKIVFMCAERSQLDEARKALEDQFLFCCQTVEAHGCQNGELINRAFDKGRGVACIARHLGVPMADTIGFGDSMNDMEMIEAVGFSVCMENGCQALKEKSDLVCPAVEADGLANAFETLHLI